MLSKTSCFKTALIKDLTRFAPAWGGYTLCLILGLLMLSHHTDLGPARDFPVVIRMMGAINLCYGLLTAQLLFGDLYSSRMCFGLHTLPMRREGWYFAHVLSGLLFSLIPTAVMTAAAIPTTLGHTLEKGWQLPLYFLLGSNLQYLFFFGVAVLTGMLAANRAGSVILYGIINFGAVGVFILVDTVFVPMLFGFVGSEEPFMYFSPVYQILDSHFITVNSYTVPGKHIGYFHLRESWWYLWVCAALGAVALLGALALYRRRDLERAGDLLAVKGLEPVFLVVFSITCATVLHFVSRGIFGLDENFVLMFAGLGAGWFFGRMLLKRTTRVFALRSWLKLGILTAAAVLLILAVRFDILGLTEKIPEKDRIASVIISQYPYEDHQDLELADPEDIDNILFIHRAALENRMEDRQIWYDGAPVDGTPENADVNLIQRNVPVRLTYRLKNGGIMTRYYYIWGHEPEGQLLKHYYSTLKAATGYDSLSWQNVRELDISGVSLPQFLTPEDLQALMEAIRLDCEAGTMAQVTGLHPPVPVLEYDTWSEYSFWLWIGWKEGGSFHLEVHADAENTLEWIRSRGIDQMVYAQNK